MYAHKENVTISTTPVAAAVCEVRKDCLCTIPADIQCCGSVSASGSVCFWASRIRIRIRQSGSGSGSFHHQARILRKNLDFYCFVTSIWLFIFIKNDVNVPMFRIRVPIRIRRIRMHGPPGSATLIVDLWDRTVLINQSINQSCCLCFVGAGGGYRGGGAGYAGYGGGADASCGAAGQRGTGAGAGYGNFWTGAGVGGLLGKSGL
jgi:hypothetical protein